MYLKDSNGKKSLTATLSIVAFVVVMLKVLFSGAAISLMGFDYTFGSIGSDEILAMLSPILGTYAFRRYTSARFPERDFGYETGSSSYEEEEEVVVGNPGSKPHDGVEP